ncbi:MAG TPA: Ig-like domain-containing protein [Longimicrobium sp.]|jgi:hypothetical protein|nr:Ig-like domain-containing protein [Longimicrobium sp.]
MRRFGLLLPLLALAAALPGCDSPTDDEAGPPAAVAVVSGSGQQAAAGQPLASPLVVRVTDAKGRPVEGQAVTFVVTAGGGTLFAGTATTGADGVAQTLWTLGTQAGSTQTVEARIVNPSTGQPLTAAFTATATAPPPPPVGPATATVAVGGRVQTAGATGGPVADPLAVRVIDAQGNPVPGVQVAWAVTAGDGTFAAPTSTTSAQGIAQAPAWTLGDGSRGTENATATVQGVGQVSFTALVGTELRKVAGDGRTASAGSVIDVAVVLTGQTGTIPGVPVTWVTSGGGTVTPYTPANAQPGYAYVHWTLGPAGSTQTLAAKAGSLTATFTATVLGAAGRTQIAQVPGRVLDATRDRVLWLDSAGTRQVKIRTLATGADGMVKVDSLVNGFSNVSGYLFPGGALVSGTGGNWFEWRGGILTGLGIFLFSPSVNGGWAAWRLYGSLDIVRRNLAAGTSTVLSVPASPYSVGPNGDVPYVLGSELYLYHDGVTSDRGPVVSTGGPSFPTSAVEVVTDGVNVGYLAANFTVGTLALYLDQPGGDVLLHSGLSAHGGVLPFYFSGGWIAYGNNVGVYRRSPSGTVQRLDSDAAPGFLRGLGPDGTVIYESGSPSQYYLVSPTGTVSHLGAALSQGQQRVVWRDGRFLLITGGTVEEVAP